MTDALPRCDRVSRQKPTLTYFDFVRRVASNGVGLPAIAAAFKPGTGLDPAFREKLMVAVSLLNRCRHCTAIHTAWGELAGLTDEELARLGDLEPDEFDRGEWVAVEYARCIARGGTGAGPLETELRRLYSPSEVAGIQAVVKMIDLANRCGNTFDAFEERLKGNGGGGGGKSSLVDELLVLGTLAPVGPPFLLISKALRVLRPRPEL